MRYLYIPLWAILFYFIFMVIFLAFNKSSIKLFVPIERKVQECKNKWKRKWTILDNFIYIIGIFACSYVIDTYNITPLMSGMLFSFYITLHEFIFVEKPEE